VFKNRTRSKIVGILSEMRFNFDRAEEDKNLCHFKEIKQPKVTNLSAHSEKAPPIFVGI
jgi:hypothetical protein